MKHIAKWMVGVGLGVVLSVGSVRAADTVSYTLSLGPGDPLSGSLAFPQFDPVVLGELLEVRLSLSGTLRADLLLQNTFNGNNTLLATLNSTVIAASPPANAPIFVNPMVSVTATLPPLSSQSFLDLTDTKFYSAQMTHLNPFKGSGLVNVGVAGAVGTFSVIPLTGKTGEGSYLADVQADVTLEYVYLIPEPAVPAGVFVALGLVGIGWRQWQRRRVEQRSAAGSRPSAAPTTHGP